MIDPSTHPLRAVLERKEGGTINFGRALRLLGRTNLAALRELIDDLEAVRTEEELFPVLYRLVDECSCAKVKSRYILVPTEQDFQLLLDDIHHHGLRHIVGVVVVLAALRYPPSEEAMKYEIWTLIRALLALITSSSSRDQTQQGSELETSHIEPLVADEELLFLAQEEPDASEP